MHIAELQKLDDDALGQALAQAFADLPEAEPARLALVRDRLPLAIKANSKNRWAQLILIGILSVSGLALAWWGVATFFQTEIETQQQTLNPLAVPLSHTPAMTTTDSEPAAEPGQTNHADELRSPIIYQQERY